MLPVSKSTRKGVNSGISPTSILPDILREKILSTLLDLKKLPGPNFTLRRRSRLILTFESEACTDLCVRQQLYISYTLEVRQTL